MLAEQHDGHKPRRAPDRLQQADPARLFGHATADEHRHAGERQSASSQLPVKRTSCALASSFASLAADALPGVQGESGRRGVGAASAEGPLVCCEELPWVAVREGSGGGGIRELQVQVVEDGLRAHGRKVRDVGLGYPDEAQAVGTEAPDQEGAEGASG